MPKMVPKIDHAIQEIETETLPRNFEGLAASKVAHGAPLGFRFGGCRLDFGRASMDLGIFV